MAKSYQTFQKRQRENKLREKAQRKRELRRERSERKKAGLSSTEGNPIYSPIIEFDPTTESEDDIEENA